MEIDCSTGARQLQPSDAEDSDLFGNSGVNLPVPQPDASSQEQEARFLLVLAAPEASVRQSYPAPAVTEEIAKFASVHTPDPQPYPH